MRKELSKMAKTFSVVLTFSLLMSSLNTMGMDKICNFVFGKPLGDRPDIQQDIQGLGGKFILQLPFVNVRGGDIEPLLDCSLMDPTNRLSCQRIHKQYHEVGSEFVQVAMAAYSGKFFGFIAGGVVGVSIFAGLTYPWASSTPSQVKVAGLSAVAVGSVTATAILGAARARQLHEARPYQQYQRNLLGIYKRVIPGDTVYIAKIAKELNVRESDI